MADDSNGMWWYRTLPGWSRTLLQMGFAGAFITYVFVSAREDRAFFREQLTAERQVFREAVTGMNKAVDALEESHRLLKKIDDNRDPANHIAPPPKPKP